jgi:hypothetical protein
MATSKDWLSGSHEGLFDQGTQTTSYLTNDILSRIGITGPILTWYDNEFIPKWTRFKTSFEAWRNSAERTPTKTTALSNAETDFRKVYRQFYTGYMKNNPLVTDEDLVSAGMPKRSSGGRKPPRKPDTLIRVTVKALGPGRLSFQYGDENSQGQAKPENVHGAEMIYAILDMPPTDWSQLIHNASDTRTPLVLEFSGEQRGKTLYFSMRWVNTRSEKGPWNAIDSAIIP